MPATGRRRDGLDCHGGSHEGDCEAWPGGAADDGERQSRAGAGCDEQMAKAAWQHLAVVSVLVVPAYA